MRKILLNSAHGQDNVNIESSVSLELSTKQRLFNGGRASGTINQYEIYLNERNETRKYKMFFTVSPYMSNVLFNMFTEVVYNEGGNNCFLLGDKKINKSGDWNKGMRAYPVGSGLTRYEAIKDTEYSHPALGNFVYHCGMDIFNNHQFRGEGYFAVRGGVGTLETGKKVTNTYVFNTIEDYLVYGDGTIATHKRETPGEGGDPTTLGGERPTHLYNHSNLMSFQNAFMTKLKEENGWLGFYNRAYANIPNHTVYVDGDVREITINKILNNRGGCEFIDMYPDRTLFSLLPKINEKYNNREEYNWDWRITYPFKKRYTNDNGEPYDFFDKDQGLKVIWHVTESLQAKGSSTNLLQEQKGVSYDYLITRETSRVHFRTKSKHGLREGDVVRVSADNKEQFSCRVVSVGDINGEMEKYYFSLSYDDLANGWGEETNYLISSTVNCIRIPSNIYVAKMVNGVACEYYIRDFKSISNLRTSINKAGFAKTIYGDPVAQIIYSDDIDISGLTDHMGRELTEVYLTFIKRNQGYKEWYKSGVTNPNYVEFSHCFGEVTSGFDFEVGEKEHMEYNLLKEYNVRMLYNAIEGNFGFPGHDKLGIPYDMPAPLEKEINAGEGYDVIFCGDFVEFSPSTVEENVLEDVYHRFNTAQREALVKSSNSKNVFPFSLYEMKYDELVFDDNDFTDALTTAATKDSIANFTINVVQGLRENVKCDNFIPEGYFYKAHHRVKLREFSNIISKDYDTQIPVALHSDGNKIKRYSDGVQYEMLLNTQYHLTTEDKIILLYPNKVYRECVVSSESSNGKIIFKCDNLPGLNPWRVYLKNSGVPDYAYYPADGTGRRIWREIILDTELPQSSDIYDRTFANGSIYMNNNIALYLRRQDPDGRYGVQYTYDRVQDYSNFVVSGVKKEMPDVNYKIIVENSACEF